MNDVRRPELPTLAVAAVIYGAFALLTWYARAIPLPILMVLGGYVVAWHGSLQHEIIHGHPTGNRALDTALALPPLGLWLPFPLYRQSHVAHHAVHELTSPRHDPESRYLEAERWAALDPVRRALWWAERTLLGRMVLGPPTITLRLVRDEARRLGRGDLSHVPAWLGHLALVALLFAWVEGVCHVGVARYLLGFAYPGFAASLIRSFHEHRPAPTQAERTVIVEAGPVMALLFLNNNLHVVHHAEPGLAWYRLPARFRAHRDELLVTNGGFRYAGYLEVVRRFGLRPKDHPVHPGLSPEDDEDAAMTAASIG